MTNKKLKAELKKAGFKTYRDIAAVTGHTETHLKNFMQPNKPIPKWGKLVLVILEGKG
tara:strand:- start:238 stop:411 length:174 start_codon:yes stop_codon:yes gene_type:complete